MPYENFNTHINMKYFFITSLLILQLIDTSAQNQNQDIESFLDFVKKNISSICGKAAIVIGLNLFQESKVNLEQYYISGELTGDYKESVSFAALVFE